MEWTHVLGIILGNGALIIPLFLWNRSESRADIRHMDAKLESNRDLVRAIHNESNSMIRAIQDEMKDFHTKLALQDAEFKGKMALQDAEFKAHIMHYHEKK